MAPGGARRGAVSTVEHHARVTALFHEALSHPTAERSGWLTTRADAPGVIAEVRTMLTHHREDGDALLDRPLLDREAEAPDPLLGETVGPWRVVALLGHGGMGTVYRAERAEADGPEGFRQSAALKLVRPGVGPGFRERFVRERALLASLDHPGVARLLDGGVTGRGWPYLAMELVEGEPITTYAERHGLGVPARLGLFVEACEAVAFAHRRLVVHRDLKPAHVLVAEDWGRGTGGWQKGTRGGSTASGSEDWGDGGRPGRGSKPPKTQSPEPGPRAARVKLLDFGVAKLLDAEDDALTRTGPGPMTPAYAAPEQVAGQPVTTATDVYALGLVLYELLAGQRPYEVSALTAAETERVIRETLPRRPSEVAPGSRARYLRGDLDAVVLRALAKEPDRRYPSADALADDLRRHLAGHPVLARPDTRGIRARAFVRRNRAAVTAAAAVLAVLVAVVSGFTWRLAAERDRAQQNAEVAQAESERSEAVAGFLEQILRAPNARWYNDAEATGPDTPIRAVLDEAARQIERDFADQPDLRADLHHVLGDTYAALGLTDEAGRHHRQVLVLRESLYAPPHPKLAEALYYGGGFAEGETYDEIAAIRSLRRAVAMQRVQPEGNNLPFMLQTLGARYLTAGDPETADSLLREGFTFVTETFVEGHDGYRYRDPVRVGLAHLLADAHLSRGDPREATRWLETSASLIDRLPRRAGYHGVWQIQMCMRGRVHARQRQFREAEPFLLACAGEEAPRAPISPFPRPETLAASDGASTALVELYEAWGRPDRADPWREAARRRGAAQDSARARLRASGVLDEPLPAW
ncbi:MAG: serine/threonine-protein kinase [Bacteroidota bacterium]